MRGLHLYLYVLRIERNLSLRKAAQLAGVSITTLSDAEAGLHVPQDATLVKLARVYRVPVDELTAPKTPPG